MKSWHVIIDIENCEDCGNCLLACKDEHLANAWPGYTQPQPRHGHRWIDVVRGERGQFPLVDVVYLPTMCMHCEDAPCMQGAFRNAVYRRQDGIVLIDPQKAEGARDLVNACPYHMIFWNEGENAPQKCTFCAHLIDDGWKETRCSQACPTGALRMEFMDHAEFARMAEEQGLETLHPEYGTRPRVYYRNLYRYTKCFIAGSVAIAKNGVVDCAAGATVALWLGDQLLAETITDGFGDFKFDRLAPSKSYALHVRLGNLGPKIISLDSLQGSVSLPVVSFESPDTT
jgi:Fe-S-cluster-containing dehydrogenase component